MATKTETVRTGEFVQSEARGERSRDEITVKSGENRSAADVMALERSGSATSAANAGNTGDGTMGAITVSADAKEGVYELVIIEPATDAGTFTVEDPDGIVVGTGTVAVAFSGGGLAFTLADGATDFAAGDGFSITLSQLTDKWVVLPNDGSELADGVLYEDVDASAADKKGVAIVRDAEVNGLLITWPAGISAGNKDLAIGQLAAKGIIVR